MQFTDNGITIECTMAEFLEYRKIYATPTKNSVIAKSKALIKPSIVSARVAEYLSIADETIGSIVKQSIEHTEIKPYWFKSFAFLRLLCANNRIDSKETLLALSARDIALNTRDNLREYGKNGTAYKILYAYNKKSLTSTVKA